MEGDETVRKTGRPNAWVEIIEPRKEEIILWAKAGASNEEIAEALGVSYSTFMKHKNENPEFSDSLKQAKLGGVPMVKLALYKRATGFEYEEKKTYIKKDDEGNESRYTEITKKQALPDVGAIQTFLRNNTENFRDKDKDTYEFKRMELELRKMLAEQNNF